MPTFALPLAPATTIYHAQSHSSRTKFSNLPVRKRKRPTALSSDNSSNEGSNDEAEDTNIGLVPASTNPLSLTPAEIAQYRVAGLRLDEEIPAVKKFPHQALPRRYSLKLESAATSRKDLKGKGEALEESEQERDTEKEVEIEEPKKGWEKGPQLRIQHLAVLTTILHRCLLEGDIERAKRAWGMLIRGQFGGKGVDLRQSGYWGIGAELLMRSFDKPGRKPSYESDSDDEDQEEENRTENGWRWGTKEGLEKVKDYYERLILQHPYKRHFHGSINTLDFWPAMVGCEIYGIQAEQKEALRKLQKEEEADDAELSGSESENSDPDDDEENAIDGGFAADQRKKDRRIKRRAESRWLRREDIRQTALAAAEKIAARLDELTGTPPFSDSHTLMRLRGMLALYVGDLSVPATPIEDDDEPDDEYNLKSSQRHFQGDNERRFIFQQRMNDYERGKKKQASEQVTARSFFSKIEKSGGSLDDLKYLSLTEGAEPEDDLEL